jgi:GT2 family glycosyltransferase
MTEQVSIITTTYRAYDKLAACIRSVRENTKYVEVKHYIYANSPDDKVKQVLHDSMFVGDILFTDRIEPIYNEDNTGSFSSNNNAAAKHAKGKYICLLNDDIQIPPENSTWLYSMVQVLESDPKVGVVGALLLYPDQKTIQHCGVFFSAQTNNLPYHMLYRRQLSGVADFLAPYRYYQAVTGACLLIRREDYEAVGGLNPSFHYGFEDTALCLAVRNKLKKLTVYCPDAKLIHDEGVTGAGKAKNPKLEGNIRALRTEYAGQYYNDLELYQANPNYMLYKRK